MSYDCGQDPGLPCAGLSVIEFLAVGLAGWLHGIFPSSVFL